jgi:molybdate transport system permease protein
VDWLAAWVTIKLAFCTTVILMIVGIPVAYWLAHTRWRGRFLIEVLVSLPLLLPPTVIGFYLLLALGPHSPLGRWLESISGSRLPFTFTGILIGSLLYNLPFSIRPFTAAFANMNRQWIEAAWCSGESRWNTFFRVTLPICWPGILSGIMLTFAHAVGEFGVILMIGGNIPGVSRTLSIAIYDDVQALDYESATYTALLLVVFSVAILCVTQYLGQRRQPL